MIKPCLTREGLPRGFFVALITSAGNIAQMRVIMTVDAIIEGYISEELKFLPIVQSFFMALYTVNIHVSSAQWKICFVVIEKGCRSKGLNIMAASTVVV